MFRLHTANEAENYKTPPADIFSLESPRNVVPQLKTKKAMPYSPKMGSKPTNSFLSSSKFHGKPAIINDEQLHNIPKKMSPKPIELVDPSIHDMTSILDEKMENSQIIVTENHLKILNEKNIEKDKILPSHDVSAVDIENPFQTVSPVLLEKKFILTGTNVCHAKTFKASLTTRDTSMSTENDNTPYIRSRPPLNRKKPSISKKASQTFDIGLSENADFEEGTVSEHPMNLDTFSSPRNIKKYETKGFSNPHNLIRGGLRKAVTECTQPDFSPERIGRSFTARFEDRSLTSKFSLSHTFTEDVVEYKIPCLLLKPRLPTNKLIFYFHGNGEDVNLAKELLTHIRDHLNINVLAIEYPGYGLYKGDASEVQIQADAEAVFDYFTTKMGMHPKNIILFGRSIGGGPATWLASRRNIGALVLMSAFTSIRAVVQHLVGKWAQYLVKERFNNLEYISRVTCPTFIVHGLKDKLIPFKHAQELYNQCKGLCELVLPKDMDHIEFDFSEDFTTPLIEFLNKISFGLGTSRNAKINFLAELFQAPLEVNRTLESFRSPRY